MSDSDTNKQSLSLIVAMSRNNVIGINGELPWRLSSDLKGFKQLTMGHHIIMGRKTFDSIGRLLPGRETVILTRQADFHFEGAKVAHNMTEALAACAGDAESFVIGGREIYEALFPAVGRVYLTRVDAEVEGDTSWEIPLTGWHLQEAEDVPAGERDEHPTRFEIWQRTGHTRREP